MIGGFGLPKRFKDVEGGFGAKLIWVVIVAIGLVVVCIPNWIDDKLSKR